jgi:hypothetical protein
MALVELSQSPHANGHAVTERWKSNLTFCEISPLVDLPALSRTEEVR